MINLFQKYLHVGEDVFNYFFFGTGPDDSTSMFERLEKTFDEFVEELGKLDVDRKATDKFKFVKIADGWTDIPDFVKDEKLGIWAEKVTKNKGNHIRNLRVDDGLHLTMDVGKDGVWLHKDVYDPNKSVVHTILHGVREVYPEPMAEAYIENGFDGNGLERE